MLCILNPGSGKGSFTSGTEKMPAKKMDSWVWLCYDQLNLELLRDVSAQPSNTGLILIESSAKGKAHPYHKQKLAFLLSNMRHFAVEAVNQGFEVQYIITEGSYHEALIHLHSTVGQIEAIEHAERATRLEVQPLVDEKILLVHPHRGWLTSEALFTDSVGNQPPFRMDAFYRNVRRKTGWLMHEGKPIGGQFSHDGENRKPWKGDPMPPSPPHFAVDHIDEEVTLLVNRFFPDHPGTANLSTVPTSQHDVEKALAFASECMPHFGTYEDAMSATNKGLFHTRLAPLINLHRVMPSQAIDLALASGEALNNVEGFVRQMVWREYVHHIHVVTDGFRTLEVARTTTRRDANWHQESPIGPEPHPNHLGQRQPLPAAYWGEKSGLSCLDRSVTSVMEDAWTHHIPRLMVLSNIGHLLDVEPRQLTDWFHFAFIDAFDWVVEPNVLGMGTFATGSAMMTKPYVAGSAYINRMSDHCSTCEFHPKKTCPISRLYWAYLARHQDAFSGNHRMSMPMRNLSRRSEEQKRIDHQTYLRVQQALTNGETLHPNDQ